ncbi:MEDS domain-containing protein [Geodermatophilus sp. SYSU D00703]
MRASGPMTEPALTGSADHVCWVHDDADSFTAAAAGFLAAGLTRGERLLYVGEDDGIARLRREPGPLGPLDDLVAAGRLTLLARTDAYTRDDRFVPEDQLAFYRAATRQAVEDGCTGLRVVAELTALAADPRTRDELARWEHLADDFMAGGSGMSALCAYRRDALDADALTAVATAHPRLHVPDEVLPDDVAPFSVFVDDGRVVVTGCVDAFGADRLHRVLTASPLDAAELATLDLSGLQFADAAGCRAIASWAQDRLRRGQEVALSGASPLFARVWRLLGYDVLVPVVPQRGSA